MSLLPDKLRRQLPPIRKNHEADEGRRMIYARLYTPRSGISFYVAEGEQREADYLLWGLIIAPHLKFPLRCQMTLSRLQTTAWLGKEPCERDEHFQPARWEVVERTIHIRDPSPEQSAVPSIGVKASVKKR